MWIILIVIIIVILYYLNSYMNGPLCKIHKDLTGLVIFITGANTGIGKETAIQLAQMGATIIIGCRDTKKGQLVVDQINRNVHMIKLDLSDLHQIRESVQEFKKLCIPKIDILINNAGIMATQTYLVSKQQFELQFATNHLGHFLLTELLMPYLKQSKNARVINVSSMAHKWGNLDFQDISSQKWRNSWLWGIKYSYSAYGNSKLCNVLHAMELKNRHGIIGCSLHPGVVRTELVRHQVQNIFLKIVYYIIQPIFHIFTKSPLLGAQTTLQCALMDINQLIDGGYYSDCKIDKAKGVSMKLAEKLWDKSIEIIQQY